MTGVNDRNALIAGLFILASVALSFGVVYAVTGGPADGGVTKRVLFAVGDDIANLGPGSEVRVGGKAVGKVTSTDFDDDYSQIVVEISVPEDLPLKEGAVARIQQTVTGIVSINIADLGDGSRLAEGDAIQGEAGTLSDVIKAFNEVTPELIDIVKTTRSETLPTANNALTKIASAADAVDSVIGSESSRQSLRDTLENLRVTSEKLPQLTEDASALVANANGAIDGVRETVREASASLDRVLTRAETVADDVADAARAAKQTMHDADAAVEDVQSVITRNKPQIGVVVDRLASTATTLELASQEIRRSPWRLLFRPDGRQRDSMNLYDAARRFAEGANALQDAAVALEGVAMDETATPDEVEALLERVRTRFDEYRAAEQALYERIRE